MRGSPWGWISTMALCFALGRGGGVKLIPSCDAPQNSPKTSPPSSLEHLPLQNRELTSAYPPPTKQHNIETQLRLDLRVAPGLVVQQQRGQMRAIHLRRHPRHLREALEAVACGVKNGLSSLQLHWLSALKNSTPSTWHPPHPLQNSVALSWGASSRPADLFCGVPRTPGSPADARAALELLQDGVAELLVRLGRALGPGAGGVALAEVARRAPAPARRQAHAKHAHTARKKRNKQLHLESPQPPEKGP